MSSKPSIADDFVQTMGLIERAFPEYDLDDPDRLAFVSLKEAAYQAISAGLQQAKSVAWAVQSVQHLRAADRRAQAQGGE